MMPSMKKGVFLGQWQFVFSQSSLSAIALRIDGIDGAINGARG